MRRDIAVIGSGPAGAGFISELVFQSNNPKMARVLSRSTIHIFDESTLLGAGLPYDETMTDPEHILNIQSTSASVPKDFTTELAAEEPWLTWMQNNKTLIETKFNKIFSERFAEKFQKRFNQEYQPEKHDEYNDLEGFADLEQHYQKLRESFQTRYLDFEKAKNFHPRILYGMFAVTQFLQDLETLEQRGIKIELHPKSQVLAIDDNANVIFTELGEEKIHNFSKIFIATGMMANQQKNDVDNPIITTLWPIKEVKDRISNLIDEAKESHKSNIKIAIKGTALAAIDIVKTIFRDGLFDNDEKGELIFAPFEEDGVKVTVDMISRTGIFPKVRGTWDETRESAIKYGNVSDLNKQIRDLPKTEFGSVPLWSIVSFISAKISEIYHENGDLEMAETFRSFADFAQENQDNNQIFQRFLSYRKSDPFAEIASDLKQALNEDGATKDIIWQNIYYQIAKFDDLLNESDKQFFDSLVRWRQNYSTPMPAQSARELLALHNSGVLNCKALGFDSTEEISAKTVQITNSFGTETYDLVINATGERLGVENINSNSSPLYQSLEKITQKSLVTISDNAHLSRDVLKDQDIIVSRRVGGIAAARRFGKGAAKEIAQDLLENEKTKNILSNPRAQALDSTKKVISL